MKRRSSQPPSSPPSQSRLLGVFAGIVLAGIFVYPSGAYPIQNLTLCGLWLLGAAGLTIQGLRCSGEPKRLWAAMLGQMPLALGLGWAAWAAVRWSAMPVQFSGRDQVCSMQWFGVSLILGVAIAHAALASGEQAHLPFGVLRKGLTLLAIGYGGLAVYQYTIGYQTTLNAFRETMAGPARDLMTQSIEYALKTRRVAGRMGDPNSLAALMTALAAPALACLRRGEKPLWKTAGGLGLAAAATSVALSGSRGGLLSLVFVAILLLPMVLLGYWNGGLPKPQAKAGRLIIFVLILVLGTLAFKSGAEDLSGRIKNTTTVQERVFYWQVAVKLWQRAPVAGEGPGSYALLYPVLKAPEAREAQYPHNWLLQALGELGAIGAVLVAGFWASVAVAFGKRMRGLVRAKGAEPGGEASWESAWMLAGALALGFNGLMQFSLNWREFLMLAGLLTGGGLGALTMTAGLPPSRPGILKNCVLALAGVAGLLAALMTPPLQAARHDQWIGKDAMQEKQWDKALSMFEKAQAWEPDDPTYKMAQAAVREASGEASLAWPLMAEAGNRNPYSASIPATQARWLAGRGRLSEAIQRVGDAIDRYPSKAEYRMDRAQYWLALGKPEAARADLDYIEQQRLPLWEFEEPRFDRLRAAAGLGKDAPTPPASTQP